MDTPKMPLARLRPTHKVGDTWLSLGAFANLKGVVCLGHTLASTLSGIVMRILAKITAYTFGLYINRMLGRPQGKVKELWA